MLPHKPGFFARHMLGPGRADPLGLAIRDAYAYGCEPSRQASLRSLTPTDLPPLRPFEHGVCRHGCDIRNVSHSWTAATGNREDQLNIVGIDLLVSWNTDSPA